MIEDNDTNLVRQCLEGDTKAFEVLVDKYQKTIFNVTYRMTNTYDDAEDITQSVFIKAYEKLSTFSPQFKFFSWIYRIAVNESLNYLNKKKRFKETNADFISKEKTPEEACIESESNKKIQDAMMKIDPQYRILIVLKHFQGHSYRKIAYILGISEKKVKSRLYTVRQLLKNLLIKNGIYK